MPKHTRIADERRAWLDHLHDVGFPLQEYHLHDVTPERKRELERWHEKLKAEWARRRK